MPKKRGKKRSWGRVFLIALAAIYVVSLVFVPLTTLVAGAFSNGVAAFFRSLFHPDALHAMRITLWMVVWAVFLNSVFGTVTAWVLVRDVFPGKKVLSALIDVPFAVSPVIAGFVLIELFGKGGLLRSITDALGIQVAFAIPGMVLATVFVSLPFVVREVMPVLAEIGVEQEQAAFTLGASPLTAFWRVTLPSIKWGLTYGVTLTAARAIGEFGAVLVVSGGVAGRTETATSFVYRALEDRNDVGAYSMALVLSIASVALLLAMEKLKHRRTGDAYTTQTDVSATSPTMALGAPQKVEP
ncbi:MAG: sulfate ABC transporter permease [Polyangiaceae bacterium]|nr:sulfate ABC transporter permease [Polyangiaceae bacterium]